MQLGNHGNISLVLMQEKRIRDFIVAVSNLKRVKVPSCCAAEGEEPVWIETTEGNKSEG